jgi:hypothetical protein
MIGIVNRFLFVLILLRRVLMLLLEELCSDGRRSMIWLIVCSVVVDTSKDLLFWVHLYS